MARCWGLQMKPTAKSVLISIADNANDEGYCWPSIAKICERTCLGRTAVINAIRLLEEIGLLKADRSNGRHTTYQFELEHLPAIASKPVREADQSGKRTGTQDEPVSEKPVREADQSASQTGSPPGPDQSVSRTGPVREADTNRQEPSLTVSTPASKPQRRNTTLPKDFGISENVRAWAMKKGYGQLDEHLEYFCRQADKKGYVYRNWDRAFEAAIADDWAGLRKPVPQPERNTLEHAMRGAR